MKHSVKVIAMLMLLVIPYVASGGEAFHFDEQNEVIGSIGRYRVKNKESLYEIARSYKTGLDSIVAANPGIDPFIPKRGTSLILPTAWVLPDVSRKSGIVVNLSEMRLYYFFIKNGERMVRTYPIGIGDEGAITPLGKFRVVEKIVNPAWHVPESIRRIKPELPAVVPPGPDNPMGSHALRLSRRTVLIHGTDVPWGIGKRVSHGCIRLYPEDIVELFHLVPVNTRVTIVQQPVKIGVSDRHVYVEVNRDSDLKTYDYLGNAKELLWKKGLFDMTDVKRLTRAVKEKRGFPVDISRVIK
jgi:L,D-transpeptidase ErfK/SrfK